MEKARLPFSLRPLKPTRKSHNANVAHILKGGAGVFTILMLAASRVLVWDFEDRGVLPGSTHVWGAAPTAYLVASLVLILAVVGLFVLKRREKAAAKAVATVAQNMQ